MEKHTGFSERRINEQPESYVIKNSKLTKASFWLVLVFVVLALPSLISGSASQKGTTDKNRENNSKKNETSQNNGKYQETNGATSVLPTPTIFLGPTINPFLNRTKKEN